MRAERKGEETRKRPPKKTTILGGDLEPKSEINKSEIRREGPAAWLTQEKSVHDQNRTQTNARDHGSMHAVVNASENCTIWV